MTKREKVLSIALFAVVIVFLINVMVSTIKRSSTILSGKLGLVEIKEAIFSSDEIVREIRFFEKRKDVKGVLLRIESPGGSVGAVQEIYRELLRLKEKKPVVASMGSIAASGGYYIACAANKIIANPGTITGSIGVILQYVNVEGVLKKIKLKPIVFKSGKFKDTGSPFRSLDEDEKRYLQSLVNELYLQFRDAVKKNRRLSDKVLDTVANGMVFTGKTALEKGLIDSIGNISDAIDALKELSGIKGEPKIIRAPKPKISILKRLLRIISDKTLDIKLPFTNFEFLYILTIP